MGFSEGWGQSLSDTSESRTAAEVLGGHFSSHQLFGHSDVVVDTGAVPSPLLPIAGSRGRQAPGAGLDAGSSPRAEAAGGGGGPSTVWVVLLSLECSPGLAQVHRAPRRKHSYTVLFPPEEQFVRGPTLSAAAP